MDFVPVIYTKDEKRRARKSILTRMGYGAASVVPVPALLAMGIGEMALTIALSVAGVGGICAMVAVAGVSQETEVLSRRNRAKRIRDSLNEHYGLDLSMGQFADLRYPEISPGPQFQLFGSIKSQEHIAGASFLERTIYLIAIDGELKLSESRDGKRFKELKTVRPALEGSSSRQALDASSPRDAIEAAAAPVGVSA